MLTMAANNDVMPDHDWQTAVLRLSAQLGDNIPDGAADSIASDAQIA